MLENEELKDNKIYVLVHIHYIHTLKMKGLRMHIIKTIYLQQQTSLNLE